MILSDLCPSFQDYDIIQRQITQKRYIDCDVYVGGKVRVAKLMMSWNLQLNSSK